MSISATHWSNVTMRVTAHAQKLYPDDTEKQQDLIEHLLAIRTERGMAKTQKELEMLEQSNEKRRKRFRYKNLFIRFYWQLYYSLQ